MNFLVIFKRYMSSGLSLISVLIVGATLTGSLLYFSQKILILQRSMSSNSEKNEKLILLKGVMVYAQYLLKRRTCVDQVTALPIATQKNGEPCVLIDDNNMERLIISANANYEFKKFAIENQEQDLMTFFGITPDLPSGTVDKTIGINSFQIMFTHSNIKSDHPLYELLNSVLAKKLQVIKIKYDSIEEKNSLNFTVSIKITLHDLDDKYIGKANSKFLIVPKPINSYALILKKGLSFSDNYSPTRKNLFRNIFSKDLKMMFHSPVLINGDLVLPKKGPVSNIIFYDQLEVGGFIRQDAGDTLDQPPIFTPDRDGNLDNIYWGDYKPMPGIRTSLVKVEKSVALDKLFAATTGISLDSSVLNFCGNYNELSQKDSFLVISRIIKETNSIKFHLGITKLDVLNQVEITPDEDTFTSSKSFSLIVNDLSQTVILKMIPPITVEPVDAESEITASTVEPVDAESEIPASTVEPVDAESEIPASTVESVDTENEITTSTIEPVDTESEITASTVEAVDTKSEVSAPIKVPTPIITYKYTSENSVVKAKWTKFSDGTEVDVSENIPKIEFYLKGEHESLIDHDCRSQKIFSIRFLNMDEAFFDDFTFPTTLAFDIEKPQGADNTPKTLTFTFSSNSQREYTLDGMDNRSYPIDMNNDSYDFGKDFYQMIALTELQNFNNEDDSYLIDPILKTNCEAPSTKYSYTQSYDETAYNSWNFKPVIGPEVRFTNVHRQTESGTDVVYGYRFYPLSEIPQGSVAYDFPDKGASINWGPTSHQYIEKTFNVFTDPPKDVSTLTLSIFNDMIFSASNDNDFHIYSILDLCVVTADAQQIMGFLTCRILRIEPRTTELAMIGTFIVDQLEIMESTKEIKWYSMRHVEAEKMAMASSPGLFPEFCKTELEDSDPNWFLNISKMTRRFHCSMDSFLEQVDPFKWYIFSPLCGRLDSNDLKTICKQSLRITKAQHYLLYENYKEVL